MTRVQTHLLYDLSAVLFYRLCFVATLVFVRELPSEPLICILSGMPSLDKGGV